MTKEILLQILSFTVKKKTELSLSAINENVRTIYFSFTPKIYTSSLFYSFNLSWFLKTLYVCALKCKKNSWRNLTDFRNTYLFYVLENCTEDALTNSADEITRKTQAGVSTIIEVYNLEDLKRFYTLCKLKTSLDSLWLYLLDENEYDELMKLFLQIIKLPHLKVCFLL